MNLRDYQRQGIMRELMHREAHPDETRLAIVMATGLGKTIIAAERARRFALNNPRLRCLVLVHTDELADQAETKIKLHAPEVTVGVVKAERDEVHAQVVIGSVQTLSQWERRARLVDVGLVIVDECHHATAESYQAILRHYGCLEDQCEPGEPPRFVPTPSLGLTATLERGDGTSLGGIWQNVVFSRDISWGVRKGFLVQPVGYRLEIPSTLGDTKTSQDAALVQGLAPQVIVKRWLELAAGVPTVAFMPLVRSARTLAAEFESAGVRAGVIHGEMPKAERRAVRAAYDRGDLTVLCNAMVLTEGWDSPRTKCVLVGRATKSRPLFIQMAGRGLRPVPGIPVEDQRCLLLVVADSTTDLCTVADLSDRPIDRSAQGALTVMEDAWDIGKELDVEPEHVWTGQVDASEFHPLVVRSSKVWKATERGTPFLPIGQQGYVFIVGTSVFVSEIVRSGHANKRRTRRMHRDLPDLEVAMVLAEDLAQDLGGDLGALLADKGRPWRKKVPGEEMLARASQLGLDAKVSKIMASKAGGKAGKVSDLIGTVIATRTLEPIVTKIKERTP